MQLGPWVDIDSDSYVRNRVYVLVVENTRDERRHTEIDYAVRAAIRLVLS